MEFSNLLQFAVEQSASDLHIQAGVAPMLRIAGRMRTVKGDPLADELVLDLLTQMVPERFRDGLSARLAQGLDFSYVLADGQRFRCSAYSHLSRPSLTMRMIPQGMLSISELRLPPVLETIAQAERGLILLTGTTGSGKSTTLAAMINQINENESFKIITVEDPVEFVHQSRKSLVSQLEVGTDTPSFDQALRQALRQDPDVVLVGELRDVETLRMALRAADTGHLVFSTVHSSDAPQTIERIITMFPASEHKLLLTQLANSIEAIISQRLVVGHDGKRRPAVEILRGGAVTAKFITEGRLKELAEYVQTGQSGMQSFDQHLLAMYEAEEIRGTEALRWATNPEAFGVAMRGIKRTGGAGH